MADTDSNADLKAAAELALDDPNCTVPSVGRMIRETLGHRDVRQTIADAMWALRLVGTTRALNLITAYINRPR
ncbi:hypothetical protein RIVERRIDER_4 [Xanthomonas phage RiverRider]|uniref:Uncharacterized protein n=1 Tax=Xanthomonas phage RiverRider TaxID=2108116 RepID=A0A2P1JUQ7_9CAUD|nr:hypothetical protein HWB58_gp04 [Xanthomonas phage RiverRider]AVO23092.1 hypothetical protein RIVERRIDER_4 [Xanthomonas phage RiverRider]